MLEAALIVGIVLAASRGVLRRDALDARRFGSRFPRELFVILRGDSPFARTQQQRSAHRGVVDRLAVDATGRRAPVDDAADERDRVALHLQHTTGDVPAPPATCAILGHADGRGLPRHRAVIADAALWLPHRGPESHFSGNAVEEHVPVVRA